MEISGAFISSLLAAQGLDCHVTQDRELTSSVTSSWGVDWNEDMIARDLMQNFFDANREQLDDVSVSDSGRDITVSAPTVFNLDRLFYLGSEKGEDDVGHYDEGFKVAAVCLLRNHAVVPVCVSGDRAVAQAIADTPVASTDMRPLTYRFYEVEPGKAGTRLLLPRCKPKLATAIRNGMTHFFTLQSLCWESSSGETQPILRFTNRALPRATCSIAT